MYNQTYLQALQAQRIWSLDYVTQLTSNTESAKSLMASYCKRGIVASVRRNMYVACDIATSTPIVDKYAIASNVNDNTFVAYHSALEFHGVAHQQTFDVLVGSSSRFRKFRFMDLTFVPCSSTIAEGITTPTMNSLVRVTDLERTVVDCIDRIDLAGGWEELVNSLASVQRIDVDKVVAYVKIYNKKVLYRKVGLMCDIFSHQWAVPQITIDSLRVASGTGVYHLTNRDESTHYLSTWNLYIPSQLIDFISQSSNDEIV